MTLHAAVITPGLKQQKRNLAQQMQFEIQNAKRIQRQLGGTWTQALRLAEKSN